MWEMAEYRERLKALGFENVMPAQIRFAEWTKKIPPTQRNWRGRRLFNETHVEAMAAWLGQRQPARAC